MTTELSVSLDDKYTAQSGRILLTGIQALVRLPIMQHLRDKQHDVHTAGYISGYRGSPLGGYDSALWSARAHLESNHIRFQPGVNEDLAATAVWGTQQLDNYGKALYDGVFSIWYGKGPGVDRSLDPIKHGNYSGTHPQGGVLLVFGDDHPGKSSTIAHQSEQAMAACSIPVLYPSTVDEIISFGLLGFAMSRYAGCWVSMKTVNETVERTETIDIPDPDVCLPEYEPEGVHFRRNVFAPQDDDITTRRKRLPAAKEFSRLNALDRPVILPVEKKLGIVTAGKAYLDVCRALSLLGLDNARAAELGIGLYKVGMIWPLEEEGLTAFADGYDEILVVEEKREFLEEQVAKILYPRLSRPSLTGKHDPMGNEVLPGDIQLEANGVALVILARLDANGVDAGIDQEVRSQLSAVSPASAAALRLPYFCSGCPHNTSTRLPEGSIAGAGIGCHSIAMMYRDDTRTATHMGGEGANWIGAAPFTTTDHIFQNLGDGTYFHSGVMAIRAAVAANVNITYKLLYNDAVALTGGQPVDGSLSVADITAQLAAEGVGTTVVVTDHLEHFDSGSGLADGVQVYHRDELDSVQRQLRATSGVSVLIYEQTCAAEKRRRRKRGTFPNPKKRVFINSDVCEGCGDCSVQSTCMSIFPLQTPLGTKRQIDQSSCNKDYSCVKGFCPSFVTVHGAELRKRDRSGLPPNLDVDIPLPKTSDAANGFACMIAGTGGTGVVTIGAVLSMAAMLDGLQATCYDMTGLSQKGGAVFSHLRIGTCPEHLLAARIGHGDADVLLAFDSMAALSAEPLKTVRTGHTEVFAQAQVAPNAILAMDSLAPVDLGAPHYELVRVAGDALVNLVDSNRIALRLLGDSIGGNMFLLGYALQRGVLPVSLRALQHAINLNGVAVEFNLTALLLGRLYAESPQKVIDALEPSESVIEEQTLDERIAFQYQRLVDYHNAAWANRFSSFVHRVREAELDAGRESGEFTRAVVDALAKLMTYKDEYEVARLHSGRDFIDGIKSQFDGTVTVRYHLAPPLFARRDPVTGHLRKREFGPWIGVAFGLLAKFKFLRHTPLDIFGYNRERREERALIDEYMQLVERQFTKMKSEDYAAAVEAAASPMNIRGFGHVKNRTLIAWREKWLV